MKASREVRPNEVVTAKVGVITRKLKVVRLIEQRISAGLVSDCLDDLTPASEYEKAREINSIVIACRPKGAGRPTKRDRRILESFFGTQD